MRPERVGDWPYLTVVRDPGPEPDLVGQDVARPDHDGDSFAWEPRPLKQATASEGRRRKHRADGAVPRGAASGGSGRDGLGASRGRDGASNGRPDDGRRPAPRHAAPPAGFGATLGRRLASPRLTSRSAAHAG